MASRVHLWTGLFITALASAASTPKTIVNDVGRALDRLSSTRKPFPLLPGVRVEPRPDSNVTTTESTPTVVHTAAKLFRSHDLVWSAAPGLDLRLTDVGPGFKLLAGPSQTPDQSRTFGVMRRMKLVLLPIMYKLGVITTLLTLLTVFALKGLSLGVLLLLMATVGLVSKFKGHGHIHGHEDLYPHPAKEVHVHVHGGSPHSAYSSYPPSHPWDRTGSPASHYDLRDYHSPWDQFIS